MDNTYVGSVEMDAKRVRWISLTRIWDKTVGIGVFVGWDKRLPNVLIISLGKWGLILGPHTLNTRGRGANAV